MTADECAAAQFIPQDSPPSLADTVIGILQNPVAGILNTFGGMILGDIMRGPTIRDPVMRRRCWEDVGALELAERNRLYEIGKRHEGRER